MGKVVSIKDGDTIEVLHNKKAERIRLTGIDCPEKKQAFGQQAKQATSSLSFGQYVTIQRIGTDRYGRTLATVILRDGKNLNHEWVSQGRCWWYRKYAPGDMALEGLENEARRARRGLWVDSRPVQPWECRKFRHPQLSSVVNG
ncbi:MAG: thermonuclease family protein [Nitrospira sp. BO4]|nr:thermonuclease family protein [Nitrospira sp. BO4]